MPNRNLRASFVDSKKINMLSAEGERMFIRLIVHVDDFGRCEADPELLLGKLFSRQLTKICVERVCCWLTELQSVGLVHLYEVDGQSYLQMLKWVKGRAHESKYPAPIEHVECFKDDNKQEEQDDSSESSKVDYELFWTAYPRKVGKQSAWLAWKRIKNRPDVGVLVAAVERQSKTKQWMDDGGKYIPHPTTWLNQHRWQDSVSIDVRKKNVSSFEEDV